MFILFDFVCWYTLKKEADISVEENDIRKQIGSRIKLARAKENLTQEQLAEKASLSTRYISQLERGLAFGSASTIVSICQALHIDSNFLFNSLLDQLPSSFFNTADTKFLETYLKLDEKNKVLICSMMAQLLKFQDQPIDLTDTKKEA